MALLRVGPCDGSWNPSLDSFFSDSSYGTHSQVFIVIIVLVLTAAVPPHWSGLGADALLLDAPGSSQKCWVVWGVSMSFSSVYELYQI